MTEKRFEIDDDDEYLIDNKTGKLYDACGGGDGFPFVINEYHKLQKENEELKQSNNEVIELILDGIVEMHDGKRDYAETLFHKAVELIK